MLYTFLERERAMAERDTSWPVKMAQFIPPPSAETLASALPFFKKRRASHFPGTWLSSKSTGTVTLSSASPSGFGPSIALILQGHVHEEHLLSSLAFTWPRFRDENGDTSSPGRVIFASYKKVCTDEKRKFAMQFETVLQAEWFFKTVQQLIAAHSGGSEGISGDDNELMDYAIPVSHVESSQSYHSEMNTAVADGQAGSPRPLRAKKSILPLSNLSVNVGAQSLPLALPPRFPSLDLQNHPADGCGEQKGEYPTIIGEGTHSEQILKEKIQAYLLDPEFQGFVDRVERIWHSMEDDLVTEVSSVHSSKG